MIARGREGLTGARREIEDLGGRALAIEADVGDYDALAEAADRVEKELGPIDVWVNNAMVTIYGRIVDIDPAEFEQVTRVTYLGQVHGALAALRYMRQRDHGTIVFIGSALAYRSIPFQGPYCAAKSAVRGFVDSLRSELLWEKSRVRLSMVHLPAVNTPQFDWARNKLGRQLSPVPPIYEPETIADAVVEAARSAPREIWLGGPTVEALVAQAAAPGVADRYLAREGTSSETTDKPARAGRPDNLFEAGRGDPGARGRFSDMSRGHATPFDPAWLRAGAALGLAGVATLAAAFVGEQLAARRSPERVRQVGGPHRPRLRSAGADR